MKCTKKESVERLTLISVKYLTVYFDNSRTAALASFTCPFSTLLFHQTSLVKRTELHLLRKCLRHLHKQVADRQMLRTLSLTLAAADTDIRTAAVSGMPPVTAVVCLIDPELHGHIVILKDIRNRYLFRTSLHTVAALGTGDRRSSSGVNSLI